jgi:hypothetical protein
MRVVDPVSFGFIPPEYRMGKRLDLAASSWSLGRGSNAAYGWLINVRDEVGRVTLLRRYDGLCLASKTVIQFIKPQVHAARWRAVYYGQTMRTFEIIYTTNL